MKAFSGDLLKTIARRTDSQIALRSCPGKVREEPGYIVVFAAKTKTTQKEAEKNKPKKPIQSNIKKLLLITKNPRNLKLMGFIYI